jgi:hypothetical protein
MGRWRLSTIVCNLLLSIYRESVFVLVRVLEGTLHVEGFKMLILRSAITVITAVLLFVACAAPAIRAQQTTAQNSAGAPLADRLNSWIGGSLEDFIRMTGPPSRDFRLADGGRVIEYDDSYDVIVPVPISHRVIVAPRDGGPNIFAAGSGSV